MSASHIRAACTDIARLCLSAAAMMAGEVSTATKVSNGRETESGGRRAASGGRVPTLILIRER